MTWNLRVVNMQAEDSENPFQNEPYLEIREVYYDQIGKPIGHCPASIGGEDIEEMKTYIEWAQEALKKPVLTFNDSHDSKKAV